ncbi:hypothetical protein [Asanoa hainanensis]|uniref:hypothetical protein n=1 Tax=Asanoa hainanensis TaxID=560556 RepID=UPI0015C595FF|nr:hypothetical protein [Asanoa hainanensis]
MLATTLMATPALAVNNAYCQIGSWSCVSASIPVNANHELGYQVRAVRGILCYYVVRDVGNGVAVASGSTTTIVGWNTIPGLYLELAGRAES